MTLPMSWYSINNSTTFVLCVILLHGVITNAHAQGCSPISFEAPITRQANGSFHCQQYAPC